MNGERGRFVGARGFGARLQITRGCFRGHQEGLQRLSGVGLAAGLGVGTVAATFAGAAVGWVLDHWLGTAPLFMVVMTLLGGCVGVVSAYRTVKSLGDGTDVQERAIGPEARRER